MMTIQKTAKPWLLLSLFLLLQCGVQLTAVAGNVMLTPNESRVINTSDTNVYGNSGDESVNLSAGVKQVTIDQNVEQVVLPLASTDYQFQQTGNRLNVYAQEGTTLITRFPVQGDDNGTQVVFADETLEAKLASGVMRLGEWNINQNIAALQPAITLSGYVTDDPLVNASITVYAWGKQTQL